MSPQRLDEWTNLDPVLMEYHLREWKVPNRSTLAFKNFCKPQLLNSQKVLDIGAGTGAAASLIAREHEEVEFICGDIVQELLDIGKRIAHEQNQKNINFEHIDWFNLDQRHDIDGVISLQTLSWLPDFQSPLKEIFEKLSPRWIAITSLFYDGDITSTVNVTEHKRKKATFYNTYSLPAIARYCDEFNYKISAIEDFNIDIDLEKPTNLDQLLTYTQRIETNNDEIKRIQISGPLLMNWKMLLIEKID